MQGAYQNFQNASSAIQRNNYVSKSQIGGAGGGGGGGNQRTRSKTTNRKKRNLYTSMGNYY
jgi:hypothetical protein